MDEQIVTSTDAAPPAVGDEHQTATPNGGEPDVSSAANESKPSDTLSLNKQELKSRWDSNYEANGKTAAGAVGLIFDLKDSEENLTFLELDAELDTGSVDVADWLSQHSELAELLANPPPQTTLEGISPKDAERFYSNALNSLFGANPSSHPVFRQLERATRKMSEEGKQTLARCAIRLGKRLSTAPEPGNVGNDEQIIVDQNAEAELDSITNGSHHMSEAWCRGDKEALAYLESVAKRSTGGK